jgi:hypothetical protein
VQVIAALDGWPLWTSPVRPGREHDTTALRAHAEALPLLTEWTDDSHAVLADLGYEPRAGGADHPYQASSGRRLTDDQCTVNLLHAATRAPAERGNSLLKTTFKALRRNQPLLLAHGRDHSRRTASAPSPARPNDLITAPGRPVTGNGSLSESR